MKIAGVIAEYNPFHNGHKYQLEEIRRRTGADYIIAAMSGDFVQRGTPAILDKYTRTQMALSEGADLVLELPFLYATASAEMFALGGVSLLQHTGITDLLCFGAETDNIALLEQLSEILAAEPEGYRKRLREELTEGLSFPAAREKALLGYLGSLSGDYPGNFSDADLKNRSDAERKRLSDAERMELADAERIGLANAERMGLSDANLRFLLHGSNNLLAIEYLKQLYQMKKEASSTSSRTMQPVLIQRKGDAYNSSEISTCYASATAIRKLLKPSDSDITADASDLHSEKASDPDHFSEPSVSQSEKPPAPGLLDVLPDTCILPLLMARKQNTLLFEEALSVPMACKLISCKYAGQPEIADCSDELRRRILNQSPAFRTYNDFCLAVKNKSITYSHVSHALLNMLFDVTEDEYAAAKKNPVPYLRVLGFRRESASLLSLLKKNASVPVITSAADGMKVLSPEATKIFRRDLYASDFYNQLIHLQSGTVIKNDFSHAMVIL